MPRAASADATARAMPLRMRAARAPLSAAAQQGRGRRGLPGRAANPTPLPGRSVAPMLAAAGRDVPRCLLWLPLAAAKGWARRRQLAVRISKFKSLAWGFSRSFGLRSRVGERVGVRGPHDAPAPAVAAERRESRLLRRRRAIVVQRLDAN
jgi:hypothetical protein